MRWIKCGKIFDPAEHLLPNGCLEFAQSPQAVEIPEGIRVYFSTRQADNGKYLSHVAFVDFARDLRSILRVSPTPVITLGEPGCFDEHGIFPFAALRHGDDILAYTCGWNRRSSVSVDTAIGLAKSVDGGATFHRQGAGPVLGPSLHEPFLVGDAFVRFINGSFHMWYIFGTRWARAHAESPPDRTYKIGHACSNDGVHWSKEEARQIVADRLGVDESQALPSVVRIGDRYHMFFCYRESFDFRANANRGYRIGHAWSVDLSTWERDDEEIPLDGTPGDWDGEMQCYPHVFEFGGEVHLLYNGNAFGKRGFGLATLHR